MHSNFTQNRAAMLAQFPPRKPPLPPFAHRLDLASRNTIAVLTGNLAWTRGKSPSCWFQGRRLLLPPGKEPGSFRWPVAGRDCAIFGFGDEWEPRERIVRLSLELIRAGSDYVTWFGQWNLTIYEDGISDATLIPDAPLSNMPAPIFRPRICS